MGPSRSGRWVTQTRVCDRLVAHQQAASLSTPESTDQTSPRVWEARQNDLYPAVLRRPSLASAGARPAQQRRGSASTAEVSVLRPRWRRVAKIRGRPEQPSGLSEYPDEY